MKKLSIILCLISIALMGCAANNETISGTHNGYGESEDRAVQRLTLTDINVDNEYADGYAWMRLSTEEYSSMDGMVNKDGKVIAAIPTTDYVDKEYEGHSEFEEGYAFLFFDTEIHVLDTKGDIISTQKIGEDYRLAACGAGYMVIENHIHDFDHNSYEYVIYNPQGEEITRYIPSDGEQHNVSNIGGGVFSIDTETEDGKNTNDIYFSKTNKWVQERVDDTIEDVDILFGDSEKRVINCYKNNEGGWITIVDKEGNVERFRLSIDPVKTNAIVAYSIVSNNYCLIIDGGSYDKSSISILDLNTGIQTNMNESYFNKVREKTTWWREYDIYFDNGVFSVPLWGDDGLFYIGLFDERSNLLSEPIRVDNYKKYSFSDGRLIIMRDNNNIDVYSVGGEQIYTVNAKENLNLNDDVEQKYSDDVFIDIGSGVGDIGVYDLDGNVLYTTLDTTNTKILLR